MSRNNDSGLAQWCGSALRIRRVAAGLTLKDMADSLNSSTSTIARWETEEHPPPADSVQRLSEIFRVEPEDFSRPPRVV